ncbi:class A beta-lactamase, subclass A2 [Chitinophaga sp. SYP-B3965]|uniref:class A beta-lactamase, subclass A2 n=1 Tax=Chitinophaga sp. SYP-B3965 TaxID=2663120 RepID=UPI0012998278|nr:class A beta-lactamase, subclass A2 [Chitinophaga sp. SYP-B3965]MRG47731.1 class A beta-lactamase, subclass A2 [Chitinophaga sp. SYP-B3965]
MKFTVLSATTLLVLAACHAPTTQSSTDSRLRLQIAQIAATIDGQVGVSIRNLDTRDTVTFNDTTNYAMHSVFKFPIAMALLHQVDQGRLQLEQKIYIDKKWMVPDTHSPLRDSFPAGNMDVTLSHLLSLMVSQSDNIACDVLIDLAGGEGAIDEYIHSLGVKDIAIAASEAKMASSWDVQFTNWSTPTAIVDLLEILNKGTALSKTTNAFLWKIMTETSTGPHRIKGLLPANVVVAHKTGTSGSKDGVYAATNDAGIIFLPNGQKLAIVVFVSMSKADEATREGVIAKVAKAAYDEAVSSDKK